MTQRSLDNRHVARILENQQHICRDELPLETARHADEESSSRELSDESFDLFDAIFGSMVSVGWLGGLLTGCVPTWSNVCNQKRCDVLVEFSKEKISISKSVFGIRGFEVVFGLDAKKSSSR